MEIDLRTRDDNYVTTVKIPPFLVPPEVIIWGTRMFYRSPDKPNTDTDYHEVFAVYALEHERKEHTD